MSEFIVSMSGNWSGKLTEIVRCVDCKHYEKPLAAHPYDDMCKRNTVSPFVVEPDGFCKWGERDA